MLYFTRHSRKVMGKSAKDEPGKLWMDSFLFVCLPNILYMDNKINLAVLKKIGVIFGVVILLGAVGFVIEVRYIKSQNKLNPSVIKTASTTSLNQTTTTPASQEQQTEIANLQKEIDQLKNSKPQTIVKQQIIKEVPAPSTNTNPSTQMSLSDMVSEWTPNVALITCDISLADNPTYAQTLNSLGIDTTPVTSQGSGFVLQIKPNNSSATPIIAVITNHHVYWGFNGFQLANSCTVYLPGGHTYSISRNDIFDVNGASGNGDSTNQTIDGQLYSVPPIDAGYFKIENPDSYITQIASQPKVCSTPPRIGDSVVILGYPAIGSDSGVTATEGIVSGIEANDYVTSAKVEHGNSGGLAVDEKNDCYIGIPTYAVSGEIESLARILDYKKIFLNY